MKARRPPRRWATPSRESDWWRRRWRALAGVGGSYLSLYYPGSWSEQISSGQGLMAVALVIFARWNPVRCLFASLLFGGVGTLGVAMQGQNLTSASVAYLWFAAPYVLTLLIMMVTCSRVAGDGRRCRPNSRECGDSCPTDNRREPIHIPGPTAGASSPRTRP